MRVKQETISRSTERYVRKHLYNYVATNQFLTPLQSGFREGDPPPINNSIHIVPFMKLLTKANK